MSEFFKRIRKIAPVLSTALLLMLGASMPSLTSFLLDRQLEQEILQREDASVSLLLSREGDLFHTLALFSAHQTQIDLTDGYRMTSQAVKSAAVQALIQLSGTDMSEDSSVQIFPQVTPLLLANKEQPGLSGVCWRCVWDGDGQSKILRRDDGMGQAAPYQADGQQILWLDDRDELMVAFQGRISFPASANYLEKESDEAFMTLVETEPFLSAAQAVAAFCRDYYPVKDVTLRTEGADGDGYRYSVVFIRDADGREETYAVPVRFQGGMIYFNI